MEKDKLDRGYKYISLLLIGAMCIMLTGAGGDTAPAHINSKEFVSDDSPIEVVDGERILLEDLVWGNCVLRVIYDLTDESKNNLGLIRHFGGEENLLGRKGEKPLIFEAGGETVKNLFPPLKFDSYYWLDEEKGVGIVSLILTEESKLLFRQMNNTVLHSLLPEDLYKSISETDSRSVQKIEIAQTYYTQEGVSGPEKAFALEEGITFVRTIDVIMPEK